MLGFSEKEVGHWTFKKWVTLFDYYKRFHNFKMNKNLFKLEPTEEEKLKSYEWFDD